MVKAYNKLIYMSLFFKLLAWRSGKVMDRHATARGLIPVPPLPVPTAMATV